MASGYTSELQCVSGNSSRLFRGYINAYVSSETTTTATITYEYKVQMKSAAQYGVQIYVYVNGTEKAHKTGAISSSSSSWKDVISSSGTTSITKTSSSQTIPVKITAKGWSGGDYGAAYGSGSTTVNVTVAAGKQAPAAATSCTLTESTKDSKATFTWVASETALQPIEAQQWACSKNGEEWVYTVISNGTARSTTFDLETNSNYRCAIRMRNSVGDSSWIYTDYIYTTPPAPNVTGLNTGEYVYLTADCSSTKWYNSHVWQVSLNGGSSWSAVDGAGPTLKYTIDTSSTNQNILRPQFRCAIKNTEGDQSAWTTCIPTYKIKAYVAIPSGSTCQGIYINDGAQSVVKKAVITLTITSGGGYVEYNGIKYTSTCTFEAAVGDTITVFCGTVPSSATIYLNGAQVSTGLASTTYMYPVVGNATIDCSTSGSSASKRANVYITEE